MTSAGKPRKFRPRLLAMLSELMLHPKVHIVRVEVQPAVHVAAVKSAAKRAGRVLHPQVASLMAELPRFCVEWYAELDSGQTHGAISLLHEYDPDRVLTYFGFEPTNAPETMRRGGLFDYGRSDDTDGALLLCDEGVLGPHVALVSRSQVDVARIEVGDYLDGVIARRGTQWATDDELGALFGTRSA